MNIVRRVQNLELKALLRASAPPPVALNNPSDVLAVLTEQVNAVRTDAYADPLERARTLAVLSGVALRAMEDRDLAARLEAVERVLKLRQRPSDGGNNGI